MLVPVTILLRPSVVGNCRGHPDGGVNTPVTNVVSVPSTLINNTVKRVFYRHLSRTRTFQPDKSC